jgi:hypothetical protein
LELTLSVMAAMVMERELKTDGHYGWWMIRFRREKEISGPKLGSLRVMVHSHLMLSQCFNENLGGILGGTHC